MDSFTLRLDDLDPTLYQAGLLAGILVDADDGQVGLDAGWFAEPGKQLGGAVADRPEALLGLLASLLGSSDPQVLGLPSPSGHGELWYPIADASGEPTGLYLVCRQVGDLLHFGVGARWSTQVDPLTISIWGHLPLIRTDGTAGNTAFVLGQGGSYETGSPVKLAVEVTSNDRFGTDTLSFRGIKLAAELLFTQVPRVSFVFLGLQLPDGQPASDRSLSDLTGIGAREWVEMAISLFVSQLTASADAGVQVVGNHLLPILGLGAGVPSIHWEQLPDRQIGVFRDWLQALVDDTAALGTWLTHWHDLLLDQVGDSPLALDGVGTRSDPYRVDLPLGASNVVLHLCMAAVSETDGSRTLYPGVWLTTPEVVLAGDTKFTFAVATEIAAIQLTNPPGGQPLPSFKAFLRLFNSAGLLVNHTFVGPSDLAPLGTFSLREIRAGLTLDGDGRPTPMIELVDLNCARGSWPALDLSSADAALDGFSAAVGSLIQEQLANALGGDDTGDHAGRHVAALLGILPPSDPAAPDPWPVELVVDAGNVTDFLGDPLSAVGCYHAACLEAQIGGAPAWRFLMHDIAGLLHHATVPAPALSGSGSAADPWRQPLYTAAEGDASLLAWTDTDAGRPQLHVALDLSLAPLNLGGGVNLVAHQQTQILHLDLPPSGACPGPVTVVWLPAIQARVRLAGAGPIVLPAAAGLTLSLTALMLSARWHHQDGFSWSAAIQDPRADWTLDNLTLPNLEFGTGIDLSWDLSLPDFGLGLDIGKLGDLFRFTFGFSLLKWGGPFGFGLAGLLGWLPDLPNLSFPGLPSWDLGPFRLPLDWPTFSPANWPAFFANPCPEIRLHLGRLFGNSRWAWPALNWLGGMFHFSLPDLALPDLGWPSLGDGGGLSFPSLPFNVTGSGTYPDPWAVRLYRTGDQEWQALVWLDPEGPPSGEAVDVMLSMLPDELQSLDALVGDDTFNFENLVTILNRLSTVDAGLRDALVAHLPADLASGLDLFEQFLSGSDGVLLSVAQQPVAPTDPAPGDPPWAWNAPTAHTDLPEATHWAQLDQPAITAAVKAKVDEWSGAADLPVLFVDAPWEDASAWTAVLAEWGSPPAAHFDLVEFGTDPALISVETVTATGRFYTADLAVVNTAPGVSPADRALPFSGPGSSQAAQLSRLLDRIRELHPGQQVIVVAHSTSGLAARAAIQADGDDSRVRGLITVGTPHLLGALPWLNNTAAREALAFLNRLDPSQIPDASLRQVVEKLLEWVKAPADLGDLTNLPAAPAHLFGDPGPANLPAGVSGHALATRLPVGTLRDRLLQWLQARLVGLRAALDGRAAPTHVGFGLRFRDTLALSPDISMRSNVRLDMTRLALGAADDSGYLTLPRLTIRKRITRGGGWLVGGVGASPRLRFADLGLALAPGEAVPLVRLYDAHVDGLEQLESGVQALTDGMYDLPVFARRILEEMFAAEGAALGSFRAQLAHLGLVESLGDASGLDTGGWDSLLADPWDYLQGRLASVMADAYTRDDFLATLPGLMGMQTAGLERWLAAPSDDTNAVKAVREVLAQLGLLYPQSRSYALNPQALLALLADPGDALTTAANALFDDEGRRLALINKLRTTLGLNDATAPSDPYDLGHGVSLDVTPAGRVRLAVAAADALQLVPGLRLYGSLTLDLGARTLEISLKLSPRYVDAALAAVYSLQPSAPASPKLQLHLGEGNLPAPYPALDLFPLSADFVDRLGEMLPRALLSTFAAQLLETQLLANRPDAGPLLNNLGLAYRRQDGAPWQVRHLDGLLLHPVQWLLSDEAMGDGSGALDPTMALDAVDNARKTLGLPGPANTLALPFGMRLRASAPGALRLDLETASPLDLAGNGTLGLALALTVAADVRVGGGGSVDLRFDLPDVPAAPDLWDQLVVRSGYDGGQFSLQLGTDATLISLVPFAGWDAVFLQVAGTARKLLPTMVEAAVEALEDGAPAGLSSFMADLRAAAATLQIDSLAGLQTLTANPVGWLQGRFSAANAAASATALFGLLNNRLAEVTDNGSGLLTYGPAAIPLEVRLGRNGQIGAWVSLTDLATGPLLTSLGAHVAIGDTVAPSVDFGVSLGMAVAPDVIQPGGVSIEPSLHFAYDGSLDLHLYPLGDAPGSPDFRLDILPSFQFRCDGGDMDDCLLAFARRVLVPLAVEMFLDNGAVTNWLNSPLVAGNNPTRPGTILIDVGLLRSDGGMGYDLVAIDDVAFPTPEQAITRLLGEGLGALQAALAGTALVDLSMEGQPGGIYLAHQLDAGGADLYGLRLLMPPRQLSSDPEVRLVLGDDAGWIAQAGGPPGLDSGISLFLLRKQGDNFSFHMSVSMVGVGIDFSGRNDTPLLEVSGFFLGGVGARLYLSLDDVISSPSVDFGAYARLDRIGLPLGLASGDNEVAQSLLGGGGNGGGENQAINPTFSVAVAWAGDLYVDLEGQRPDEAWFPIQTTFGPVHIDQIGVRWIQADHALSILVDGGVTIEGLAVGFDDLSVIIPVKTVLDLGTWSLGLRGLAIAYSGGGVRITGALRQVGDGANVRYDGLCLVEVSGRTFTAMGSYMKDPFTSMFVFVLLPITIGGPPYLFIIGLAGGFGYNRGLEVPDVAGIPDFPLVSGARGDPSFSSEPMQALIRMGDAIVPRRGSYWIAAGIRFTSFALVDSVALVYVLLDRGLEIGLLGVSQMKLPPGAPLVNIEMALKARFSTIEGVFSVEARLTDNSWLLYRDCRLTGGFAFFMWFGGAHKGDFVISMGGYHPRFSKPAHYPDVPRLGFNWRVSSCVTIKGESYFALTPSCVMAGGLLEAVYKSGNLKAWFTAYAHFLISWKPFAYDIEIGMSIGVSYRLKVWLLFGSVTVTFKVELGARLWIWGPRLSGEVEVTWWVISFTFGFGAGDQKTDDSAIEWDEFRNGFLPADDDIVAGFVEKGMLDEAEESGDDKRWLLHPEFMLRVETVIATTRIVVGSREEADSPEVDIRPMHKNDVESTLHVSIRRFAAGGGEEPCLDENDAEYENCADALGYEIMTGNVPGALWLFEDRDERPAADVIPSWTGVRLVADIDEQSLRRTDELAVKKIYEEGFYPLPFTQEIQARMMVEAGAQIANLLDQVQAFDSAQILHASRSILGSGDWDARRHHTLEILGGLGYTVPSRLSLNVTRAYLAGRRNAPPLIASLYENMAADTLQEVETTPYPVPPPVPAHRYALVPALKAVLRARPEPTGQKSRAMRTTVEKVTNGTQLPRMSIAALVGIPVTGATLQRQSAPQASRATASASRGVAFVNSHFATAAQRKGFADLQEQGVVVLPEGQPATTDAMAAAMVQQQKGVSLQAGTTQVWELPTRNAVGEMPTLFYDGDQALRITCLDRGNHLLADVEMVGSGQYTPPRGTARLALSGMGKPAQPGRVEPVMGAVGLEQATHPVVVIGWQGSSELVQVGRSTLLGRSAVLRTGAPVRTRRQGRRVDQALLKATEALRGQTGIETHLPPRVTTVGVFVERDDPATETDLAAGMGITVQGAKLASQPVSVVGGGRALLLYDVLSVEEGAAWFSVGVAARPGWGIEGVIGLKGTARHWAETLANQPLATLVENGPLTPQGETHVLFMARPGEE